MCKTINKTIFFLPEISKLTVWQESGTIVKQIIISWWSIKLSLLSLFTCIPEQTEMLHEDIENGWMEFKGWLDVFKGFLWTIFSHFLFERCSNKTCEALFVLLLMVIRAPPHLPPPLPPPSPCTDPPPKFSSVGGSPLSGFVPSARCPIAPSFIPTPSPRRRTCDT